MMGNIGRLWVNKLLNKDNSVLFHYRSMQTLASKMYKATNCFSEDIINEICQLRDNRNYNLRHTSQFVITLIDTCFRSSRSPSLFN